MLLAVKSKVLLTKVLIHLTVIWALIYLYWAAAEDMLGADPVAAVIHFTGIGALNLLLLTLAVSPLAKRLKQGWLLRVRRLLGLYCFLYGFIHVMNFFVFDLQLNVKLLLNEIIKRPYITIGMFALLLLTTLAITSIAGIRRKMGAKWQILHNSIYLIVLLVVWHFYWSVKADVTEAVVYLLISVLLLAFRRKKRLW